MIDTKDQTNVIVYLVGTNHARGVVPNPELEEAIKTVSEIEIEGIDYQNTKFATMLKEPFLVIATFLLFQLEKIFSSSRKSRKDVDSIVEIKNKLRGAEIKIIKECDASLEEMINMYHK